MQNHCFVRDTEFEMGNLNDSPKFLVTRHKLCWGSKIKQEKRTTNVKES